MITEELIFKLNGYGFFFFLLDTKFKLPIVLLDSFVFYANRVNIYIYMFDEGEKERMCVKCQLSALSLIFSLYVVANERNPTCHSTE